MIDLFTLLTPLAVLPIVALLVFVGCTVDTSANGDRPYCGMNYVSLLDADIATLAPSFVVVIGDWKGTFEIEAPQPPKPAGGSISVHVGTEEGDKDPMPAGKGTITGHCRILLKSGALVTLHTDAQPYGSEGMSFSLHKSLFKLAPSDPDFYLTVP